MSVDESQVERAFDALAGLLFSADSPVDSWKVTDMSKAPSGDRISRGAQFTLFVNPSGGPAYSAQHLGRIRDFLGRVEAELAEEGIDSGDRPDSDVAASHWRYVSYRNESRSDRTGSEEQSRALEAEPFFRLVSHVTR